jgi:Secretion system C-terminal sorting domain
MLVLFSLFYHFKKQIIMKRIFTGLGLIINSTLIFSQISITSPTFTYSQTFDANTVPTDWAFFETLANANTSFTTGTGTGTAGDTYFLGTSGEYAFGGLQSGSLIPTVGVCFINNTGAVISSLKFAYTGETWRVGTASRSDRLDFQINYSTSAINGLGTWVDVDALDYANPGQATGSGSMQHSASISSTLTGLTIAVGATFCIRWNDFNATGSDDAMAVDNFTLGDVVLGVEYSSLNIVKKNNASYLSWQTATEKNNAQFQIERSQSGENFSKIGEVKGKGTSNVEQNYSYTDANPLKGINYYRLRQVDFDGTESVSKAVSINFDDKGQNKVKVFPSPTHDIINIELSGEGKTEISIRDMTGRVVLTQNTEGVSFTTLNLATLSNGLYIMSVRSNEVTESVKIQKY